MLTPTTGRMERYHGPSDSYHETKTKGRKCLNEESRNRCSRSEGFVLVHPLAAAQIASARSRSMAVSYRS